MIDRDDALAQLKSMEYKGEPRDSEADHDRADEILLQLLGDPEIRKAYEAIRKWYA
jgi:hypothetical protein